MGQDIELIKYVLKNAIFHLDSEGGLTHLATQLGTKCIVLFGPTQVELLGYSQNINIVASTCKGCYFLYDDMMKCARDLQEPECMHSITPELVMEKVDTYLMEVDCQANFD